MITYVQAAQAIQTCAVGMVGVTLLFKILPMFRLDCFRQKMFAVRDELFDFAAAGNISFDDPAYILLRRQMNGMIRYGHQLTLFRAMISSGMKKAAGDKQTLVWYASWEKSLENVKSDEVRSQLRTFHDRSTAIAAKHLISGSLVLWVLLACVTLYLAARGAAVGIKQLLKAASQRVLSGPIDQRFIEEDAVGSMA